MKIGEGPKLPAALVQPVNKSRVIWFVDGGAAKLVRPDASLKMVDIP